MPKALDAASRKKIAAAASRLLADSYTWLLACLAARGSNRS